MPLVAPSILSADFGRLAEEVAAVDRAGAHWIHVDVMDAHFVDNLTMGPTVARGIRHATNLPIDVHLMITDPEKYAPRFLEALRRDDDAEAVRYVTVHWEVLGSVAACERAFRAIEAAGGRPGVVSHPGTPAEPILPLVTSASLILVMSVEPGWGGQAFDPGSLPKLEALREARQKAGSEVLLEIDGGISPKPGPDGGPSTARLATDAGADILVAGSAVFGSGDYAGAIAALADPN
jgi:ribulose-phosphate 3-epimerase